MEGIPVLGKSGNPLNPLDLLSTLQAALNRTRMQQLQDGSLEHAANLTIDEQVSDLARWLVEI